MSRQRAATYAVDTTLLESNWFLTDCTSTASFSKLMSVGQYAASNNVSVKIATSVALFLSNARRSRSVLADVAASSNVRVSQPNLMLRYSSNTSRLCARETPLQQCARV
jgi:hypothetical protein